MSDTLSDDDTPRRTWAARAARILLGVAAAVALLLVLLLALLHAPPVARAVTRAAVAKASAALGCAVEAGEVRWNLLAGWVELRDVALRGTGERAGTEILVPRGRADLSVSALLRRRIVLEEVVVDDPSARLALDADGRLLLPFPLPEDEEETPDTGRPDVEVRVFRLSGGRVELLDRGPAGRRATLEDLALDGRLSLRGLDSTGTLRVGGIEVSARDVEPLRGSTFSARWETRGDAGTAAARLDARPAGLVLEGDGRFRGLAETPAWDARISARGELGPLAARLAPGLGLGGTLEATVEARGAGAEPPELSATARAGEVTLLGRSLDRVDAAAELAGGLLRKGTLDVSAGRGRLWVEAAGTLSPSPQDLRFDLRAAGLDVARLVPARPGVPRLAGTLDGSVAGTLARPELAGLAATADLTLRGARGPGRGVLAPDVRLRARVTSGVVTVEEARLSERSTRAELAGSYDHARGTFEGTLEAASADVGPYLALVGLDGKGSLSVSLAGGGPVARPSLDGRLRARDLAVREARIDCVELDARSNGSRLSVSNGVVAGHGVTAGFEAEGSLPVAGARSPAIDLRVRGARLARAPLPDLDARATLGATVGVDVRAADGSLSASFLLSAAGGYRAEAVLDGFDLGPLSAFLPAQLSGLAGAVTGRVTASGTRSGEQEATAEVEEAWAAAAGRRVSLSGGAATVRNGRFEVTRLELRGDDGSLLAVAGDGRADATALDLVARLSIPDLAAWSGLLPPPEEGTEPQPLAGSVSGELSVAGSLERPAVAGKLAARDVRALGASLARLDVTLAPGDDGRLSATARLEELSREELRLPAARLEAVLAGSAWTADGEAFDGRLRLRATGSLAGERPFDATATLDALDLAPFLRAAGGPADVSARTTGRVRLRGTVSGPGAPSVDAELASLEAKHAAWDLEAAEPVRVTWDGTRLDVRSLRLAGRRATLEASGSLPLEGRGGKLAVASSLDLAVLLPFVEELDRADGRLSARLEVAGSFAEPSAEGSVTFEEALLDGPSFPTPVEKLSGTVTARRDELRTDELSARIGSGTVVVAGSVGLADGKPSRVDATLRARDLDLEYGTDVQVRAGADLAATGPWAEVAVTGEVRLEDVVWVPALDLTGLLKSLAARRRPHAPEKEAEPSALVPGLRMDVAVVARDAIHVEGILGDAELGGTLRVKGTPEKPVVLGTVRSTRGTVNLFGSVFELSRCHLEFSDPLAVDPELDVVATTTKGDEEITIRVDGRASKAQLLLSSSKGRSQADIVSVLLGGSGTGSGSEVTAAAAKMAVRGAASPILGALGGHTDFEIVPLPTTPEGEEFLFSVGKDLGGGVSATYYKGVSGETTDAIEMKWRISSRARGRLRQNQDGSLSGGFRIRRDLD